MTEDRIDPAGLPGPSTSRDELSTPDQGSIAKGIGLAAALHAAAVLVGCACSIAFNGEAMSGLVPFMGIGVLQLCYLGPACVVCKRKQLSRTLKGLLIAMGITFLVNAACAGLVMVSLSGSSFR